MSTTTTTSSPIRSPTGRGLPRVVLTGDVRLTADLVDCPGPGLVIGASGVTIDLAGHTIDGTVADAGIENGAGHDRVVVRGGTIQEFLFGVHLFETTGARLERATVRANVDGVKVSRSQRLDIDDVTASANAVAGIEITFSERTTVRRSTAADNGLFGIVDRFPANSRHEQNTLHGNAADGIQLVDVEGHCSGLVCR